MNGLIQGNDAILSFDKNGFVPFLCATDISVSLTSTELPIRTVKDGHWKKVTYQDASFSVTLSGLLKFDNDSAWTGWDMVDNWLNFAHVTFRITFTDDIGDVKSLQGEAMIKTNTLSFSAGSLVKNDFELLGNGALAVFDGIFPCPSTIVTITVTGQTAGDGIAHFAYTYLGAPYQVKYRLDNTGNYLYALIDAAFQITSLAVGSHSIEIIPVCGNGYEGTGTTQSFVITQSLTCDSVIGEITITTATATPVYTGTPANYKYSIDGAAWVYLPITTAAPVAGLGVGVHTIQMVPVCANGVEGIGFTKTFTISSQPAQTTISWDFVNHRSADGGMQVYVNGILVVSESVSSNSGSIVVFTGDSVKGVIYASNISVGVHIELQTLQNGSVLDDTSGLVGGGPITAVPYTFTAIGGDSYSITGILG